MVSRTSGLQSPKAFVFINTEGSVNYEGKKFNVDSVEVVVEQFLQNAMQFYGKSSVEVLHWPEHKVSQTAPVLGSKIALESEGPKFISFSSPEFHDSEKVAEVVESLKKNDNVVVFLVEIEPQELVRKRRAVTSDPSLKDDLNLGESYNEYYPVIFNIILWFGIAMAVTIASVAYCIWFMDPGKDGIIYRKTASRVKKDL